MKQAEIKELSIEDLKEKLVELTAQHEKLTLSHKVSQLENPIQIRDGRKTIARLQTEIRSRVLSTETTSL
ncbi:50S ribosomal protein L29 [Crocinitomix catalasitica]|uniref:50S ribosomal protein L29 n=1 Tax=Crocinitomix catalasitica TaxID=184607 RepID=UPI00048959E5|nr:50S ribosomal protein L29 [Crocinitomix catalasitica]|tara:strand:- start:168 stop:377 length:210 start_codon:yes stop_codon:yes gene_type:complete